MHFVLSIHLPDLFFTLLTKQTPIARHFREYIRSYDSVPSMGSVTASFVTRGYGYSMFISTITLYGRIYHYINAILTCPNTRTSFLSVYICDTDFISQRETRTESMFKLRANLLQHVAGMIQDVSLYVQSFMSLRE